MSCARFLALLFTFGQAIAFAQSAELNGRITDSSGSVLPGVKLAVTNSATEAVRDASTNDLGYYTVLRLQPGAYSLKAEKQGFRGIVETSINLEVDQRATVEFTMVVGDLAQEVSVKAIAPLLDTVEPSIGQVIDNRQIVSLPLNGRDYAQLALLSSGTTNPIAGSRAGGFSSGGQRLSANNYLLDGVDNNSLELADAGRSAALWSTSPSSQARMPSTAPPLSSFETKRWMRVISSLAPPRPRLNSEEISMALRWAAL